MDGKQATAQEDLVESEKPSPAARSPRVEDREYLGGPDQGRILGYDGKVMVHGHSLELGISCFS